VWNLCVLVLRCDYGRALGPLNLPRTRLTKACCSLGHPVHRVASHLHDIFVSYGHEDLSTASRFAEGLEREGFTVCWDASDSAPDFSSINEQVRSPNFPWPR
jgi:hypothetical protein